MASYERTPAGRRVRNGSRKLGHVVCGEEEPGNHAQLLGRASWTSCGHGWDADLCSQTAFVFDVLCLEEYVAKALGDESALSLLLRAVGTAPMGPREALALGATSAPVCHGTWCLAWVSIQTRGRGVGAEELGKGPRRKEAPLSFQGQ